MNLIRAMLVDDERLGRNRLRRLLEAEADIQIVAECGDGIAAVEAARAHAPDLLFLDINMPGLDGFGVLDALGPGRQPAAVIFVTAYDEHAVRAFEACALDYLLKPTSPERLAKALGRARERIALVGAPPPAPAPFLDAGKSAAAPPQRFTVRSGGMMTFVTPGQIDWVEAAGNYAILHAGPHNHMVRETMGALEAQLGGEGFLRVSRSAIVNLRRVKALYSSPAGEHAAVLRDDQRVPFTRSIREVAERLAACP